MRKKIPKILMVFTACVVFVSVADSVEAVIVDVDIVPEVPTLTDVITIVTFGQEGSGPVAIDGSDFLINGTSLELDIYLNVGFSTVVTPWSHPEDIGTLPAGMYDLTVRTFVLPEITEIADTYSVTFDVVPEPATVCLFGLGGLILRMA